MLRLSICEHGRLRHAEVPARSLRLLRATEEARARRGLPTVLDWSRAYELRAKSYVGVVQVQGLSLEILPKLSLTSDRELPTEQEAELAQRNLLYMLTEAKYVRGCERELARQAAPRAPLLEVLIRSFTESLLAELLRGLDHAYVQREENAEVVRGRLLLGAHLRRNCASPNRLYQEISTFESNTPLNQVLKAACSLLLQVTTSSSTARLLRQALTYFHEVSLPPTSALSDGSLHRNNARFAEVFEFARLVLAQRSPSLQAGEHSAFSLLFPMEKVFEGMVAALLQSGARARGLSPGEVIVQARGYERRLLRAEDGSEHFGLRPDVLIGATPNPRVILDVKWKRLDLAQRSVGVPRSDVYQVLAYAAAYEGTDVVLLFPRAPGSGSTQFWTARGTSVRIETVDLVRDLFRCRGALRDELCELARLGGGPPVGASS